jgi:hypothetical protein
MGQPNDQFFSMLTEWHYFFSSEMKVETWITA